MQGVIKEFGVQTKGIYTNQVWIYRQIGSIYDVNGNSMTTV